MKLNKITRCIVLITFLISTAGCKDKDTGRKNDSLILTDTITVAYHDTLHSSKENSWISFDSLINDSRCPSGCNCIWEGEATVKITFSIAGHKKTVVLSTLNAQDISISNFKIRLVDVIPYPNGSKIISENYKMKVFVSKD